MCPDSGQYFVIASVKILDNLVRPPRLCSLEEGRRGTAESDEIVSLGFEVMSMVCLIT